ncbi:glutamyl-tRNA reductase [Aliikangiella coralliicola]|uniref:Glutamyl-tRNA reductase n=1 Tax=Aliikangiella coralliicola TaxID=2592383 RepID=A0A545TVZ9_9GAMM|nr:glutamyl-tRNA reductase [Aliikangiella coralliicola]TQV81408.1 glutamyl-tRNA reductase [Aliikangiella coralliicola]
MPVSIFGINHKTAPVEVREKVAFAPDRMGESLLALKDDVELEEVAIISTCNRMEIIYCCENLSAKPELLSAKFKQISDWLIEHHQLNIGSIEEFSYAHSGESAVNHIMSVACGLDSMVLGEPQILGQVKDAYGYANSAGTIGFYLNRLFQQTFSLAKQVRTDTQIGESAVSVAYAAVTLAKRIFADFAPVKALFIGAGETIELAARHLARQGVVQMSVANRTVERAQTLASEFGAVAYSLNALPELVESADIIISSTASPVPIIGKGLMEKAIRTRKHRPVFIVDLAVPRDIEPQVAELSDVYLYTVDDMQDVIKENLKIREQAASEAQDIIGLHSQKYMGWLQSLSAVSLLKDFRAQIDEIKSTELARSIAKLNSNEDTESVLQEFANRLTQKFMHSPSKLIRQAGEENKQQVLEIVADAFSLKPRNEE